MVKIILSLLLFFSLKSFAATLDLSNMKDLNGKPISIDEKQDKIFLYFWAYWCPDCEGKIKSYFPKNQDRIKIPVITINTDSKENKVRGFVEKNNMSLPVIMDMDKTIRKFTSINGVPGWALLAKEKTGLYKLISSQNGFDEAEVSKILNIN